LGKRSIYQQPEWYLHTFDTRYIPVSEANPTGIMAAAKARKDTREPTTHVVLMQSLLDALVKFLLYTAPNTSTDQIVRDVDELLPIYLTTQVFPRTQGEVPTRIKFKHRARRRNSPFDILWRGNNGISKRILGNGRNYLLKAEDCGALKVMGFLKEINLWPALSDTPAATKALFETHFSEQFAVCAFSSLAPSWTSSGSSISKLNLITKMALSHLHFPPYPLRIRAEEGPHPTQDQGR
jgi:hypothetical protein